MPEIPKPDTCRVTTSLLTTTLVLLTAFLFAAVADGSPADAAPSTDALAAITDTPTADTTSALTFYDSLDSVHADAIHGLAAAGIVRGCATNRFCPDDAVTRAQFATLVTQTLGLPVAADLPFSDVSAAQTHAGAIAAAARAGIVAGTTDGRFRPNAHVTRAQAASMIARAFELTTTAAAPFVDVAGSTHGEAIAAVADAAVSVGCRLRKFCPGATLTRGQAASLVQRAGKVEKRTASTPTPVDPPNSGMQMGLPSKVVGGYWTYWRAPRLRDVPAAYNTLYLFSARPVGGQPGTDGSVFFDQSNQTRAELVADIAHLRDQGRAIILSIGGAGEALDISTNARREAFLASIHRIHQDLGGFDGIDWNIEDERLILANIPNAVWVSQQLKATYGPRFAITTPPAPWREADMDFVSALDRAGALDLVAPQFYDHPNLIQAGYVVDSVTQWIDLVGGDASKVGVGYRNVGPAEHVMPVARSVDTYQTLARRHPDLRGAFVWEIDADRGTSYGFANNLGPIITR